MNTRRSFLRNTSLAAGLLLFKSPFRAMASDHPHVIRLSGDDALLHVHYTNDMHGNVFSAPTPTRDLLVDAGDFTDGSNNSTRNLATIAAMNKAGYHAATIGNRELAAGQAALASLISAMNFQLVNCNYRFTDAQLIKKVKQEIIVYKGGLKIGITGVGPTLNNIDGVTVLPAIESANKVAKRLKQQGCHTVICLSHLGFDPNGDKACNMNLAETSTDIDFIVGGHHHGVDPNIQVLRNAADKEVLLGHTGANGNVKGSLVINFNEERQKQTILSRLHLA
ncbi:metallophosphoesterase [Chitinophaga sp. Hz27]|uniref:metallophosphoesterase n=1 Tax=Chitinophaga sp. Hz27 TaxID=3347169 RepID=UPI0035D5334F